METTEGQKIISRLKELELISDNSPITNVNDDPVRNKLLYIEKDMILKFIHDNEHNITREIMRRLKRLIIILMKDHNNNISNIELIRRIIGISLGYRIQRNSSLE